MKRILIFTVAMALIVLSQGRCLAAEESTPEKVLQTWCDAVKAGALQQVMSCYEDSEEVVVILSLGVQRQGLDAVRKEYESAFEEVVFDKVELQDLSLRKTDHVAWGVARFKADTTRRSDKTHWRLELRTSYVLKQTDRGWKIAFEHSSPIAGIDRAKRANGER